MKQPSKIAAEWILLLTTAIWGSTFLITKLLVSGDSQISPFELLSIRFLLATVASAIVLHPKRLPNKTEITGAIIIGIFAFGGYAFQTVGLVYTTPAKSGFITSLFVLFIPFISRIWEKTKIPLSVYFALIPAAIGLWLISGVGRQISGINFGDKITLLCALSYAFQIVGIQIYTQKCDWKWLSILQFGLIGICSVVFWGFEGFSISSWSMTQMGGTLYLALVASVGALGIQMFAQRFTTSSRASLIYISEPLFATGFAWAILGDAIHGFELLGGIAIIASMLIGRIPSKSV
jgi:drug/metabolite transporter (DMT)-like permease